VMIDVDSTICEVHGYHKQGACYGYTHRLGYHPLLATRADTGEMLHARLRKGAANTARGIARFVDELVARLRRAGAVGELTFRMDSGFWSAKLILRLRAHKVHYSITVRQTKTVRAAITAIPDAAWVSILYAPDGVAEVAETPYQGDRLIVRRVRNLGDQAQRFPSWRYHAFVTNRVGTTTWLDADHRRHAVCELAIRDLKAGTGLAHLPSGRFAANAAWLLAATLAHNLIRWTATLGLGVGDQQTVAKTLRLGWSAARRPLRPARHGVGSTTQPLNHQQPTLTRHLPRPAVTQRERPHAAPWATSGTSRRIRGSVDPGSGHTLTRWPAPGGGPPPAHAGPPAPWPAAEVPRRRRQRSQGR
jgi:hypothetical protein